MFCLQGLSACTHTRCMMTCKPPHLRRRSVGGSDSLMRSNQAEIVNICVACVCLVPLLGVGTWFGLRTVAALRCPTTVRWGRQRKYLLAMTGLDLALQLINLAVFLASNVYSLVYPCALYAPAMDVFFLLSMTSERPLLGRVGRVA